MGTRSGDIDPGVLLHLARTEGLDLDALDDLCNRKSGLAGLSGAGSDLRDIEAKAEEGDEDCRLAIQVFCHRLRKYIGAYAAVMGGVDAIVFTAGIGQNSAVIRHRVLQRLDFLGARLDEDLNRDASVSFKSPVAKISSDNSRVHLLVAKTNEALQIAQQAEQVCASITPESTNERTIPVAISARHIHLTQETVEALFGDGHGTFTAMHCIRKSGRHCRFNCFRMSHEQMITFGEVLRQDFPVGIPNLLQAKESFIFRQAIVM